jgi:hypothetical protein
MGNDKLREWMNGRMQECRNARMLSEAKSRHCGERMLLRLSNVHGTLKRQTTISKYEPNFPYTIYLIPFLAPRTLFHYFSRKKLLK